MSRTTPVSNKEAIIEIRGELRLLNQKIHIIETNHLKHLETKIDSINRVLWTVGVMVFGQLLWIVKTITIGG